MIQWKIKTKNEKKEDKKNVNKHMHNAAAIRPIRYREHVKERETKKTTEDWVLLAMKTAKAVYKNRNTQLQLIYFS